MGVRTEVSCPHCGTSLGMIQWTFRKASGPIAFHCPDCAYIADVSELAVEWELLSPSEKSLRLAATALVSIGGGFGIALIMSIFGWLFGHNLDWFKQESLPIRSPYFLGTVFLIGTVLTVLQFRHMMAGDVPGSRLRLADPKYRKLLVRLNLMESGH